MIGRVRALNSHVSVAVAPPDHSGHTILAVQADVEEGRVLRETERIGTALRDRTPIESNRRTTLPRWGYCARAVRPQPVITVQERVR